MSTRRKTRAANNSRLENSRDIEVDQDEENHLVGMVIRYIFAVNRLKTAIAGDQIKKICLPGGAQNYASIMTKVKKKLSDIFGYELIEIGGLKYILVNQIHNHDLELSTEKESAERTLLFLTLSYIFMSSDHENISVKEDELWTFFTNLKLLREDNTQHKYFGNIRKLITGQFVDQLYLIRRKINNTDEVSYEWGPRANAEISRRSVLEFVSKVYNGRALESWPIQWATIQNMENPRIEDD